MIWHKDDHQNAMWLSKRNWRNNYVQFTFLYCVFPMKYKMLPGIWHFLQYPHWEPGFMLRFLPCIVYLGKKKCMPWATDRERDMVTLNSLEGSSGSSFPWLQKSNKLLMCRFPDTWHFFLFMKFEGTRMPWSKSNKVSIQLDSSP